MNSSDDYDSENVMEENFIDCGVKDMSVLHFKTHITTLNLHYNNITIIKGLQNLTHLRHLDLSSNTISKINGLESLVSLRTLNLSCNRLKKVEGLVRCRQLVRLNVSYNEINDISGLGELSQLCDHPLTVVEACSNQLRLISHLVNNCQRLTNLRQLNLLNNPICTTSDYRNKVMKGLSQVKILDGKDISGKDIEMNILSDIPGLEQFMEFLSSSTEQYSECAGKLTTPRGHGFNANASEQPRMINEQPVRVTQSEMELKHRLQELEEKLTKFVTEKQDPVPVVSNKAEESSVKVRESNFKEAKQDEMKEKRDRTDRSDVKVAKLMKDLDQERRKRLDMENKLQVLVTRYKELQLQLTNDKKGKEDAMKSTEKLGYAFTHEKAAKEALERKLEEQEDDWNQRHKDLLDWKRKLEFSVEEVRSKLELKEKELLNKSEELLQLNRSFEEIKLKQQVAESSMLAMKKHCSNLEEQADNLQSTMSRREKEYQLTMANRFSIDSKELQDYVQAQLNSVREQCQHENRLIKEKLNDCNIRYKALEDEFRLALHMEADRYDKMEQSYRQIAAERTALKSKLDTTSRRDIESKSLIEELTTVVKDQKSKLIELSKNKQEKSKDNKERILSLEAHLEEARKQMIQFELTKQENKKLQAKQSAQESVIEGLRAERKLWSEELAQQGYLLTQDRSKLECKIEAQCSDISRVKMELEKEAETSRNKSKMIEEQTATILKLKEGLLEKDQEARAFSEKLLEDQRELENRVKYLMQDNNQYKDTIGKLTARKEELKNVIVDLEEKLEDSMATQELVNQKWKEKSELISKLESQVVQMKNYWEKKTDELMEERNETVDKYRELKAQFDSVEHNYKSQLDMAYKNKDFIEQKADERVAAVENEMRRLLMETDEEKRKLQVRLRILNRAIDDVDTDKKL